ncbi:replication initiation protein [Achromobacter insolitus]|uniref:replication initiation protein n=1 Tax=Achromobacter insolitus TaxID=217204 RepID=UPI00244EE33D|nr:replication initiation protein [Achromobacter insolitus]MDH3066633.1 replication initiation protein [Achromobacter insolitus]
MSASLRARIESSAPRRPWCGQEKYLSRVRPLKTALDLPYLQLNQPSQAFWLQLDIDRPAASHAWQDCDLPPPTYVVVNPMNGHAQYGYALAEPVCVTEAARPKPLAYLAAIEYAYNRVLRADVAFRGPLAKNPLHPAWRLWEPANDPVYELSDLAEHVELPSLALMQAGQLNMQYASLGRNCALFEQLRRVAYATVRSYWGPDGRDAFLAHLLIQAASLNVRFPTPLGTGEVKGIAGSIARWIWKRFTPGAFRDRQAACGRASGVARRSATQEKRVQAIAAASRGLSTRTIAELVGMNQSSIVRWLRAEGRG